MYIVSPTPFSICTLALLACAVGATNSPTPASTVPQTNQPLQLRDVNILAITDVHSWIAGGDVQVPAGTPVLDATLGDLVSLTQRLREQARLDGTDIFLVDNGDVVDGTGISNAVSDHCSALLPLLQTVPYDALNCGNHELYNNATIEAFDRSGYIDSWQGKYLTSNILNATTGNPLGARYAVLEGNVSGVKLLTFGFMYNMGTDEGRCEAVSIVSVEQTVASAWFLQALAEQGTTADAILVLAHMDAHEPLLSVIVGAIRNVLPHIPIQIVAGHSHVRAETLIDPRAHVYEPGNYFNTIGFASFALPSSTSDPVEFNVQDLYTNKEVIATAVNQTATTLPTPDGMRLGFHIQREQDALGLNRMLGCADKDYLQGPTLTALYFDNVIRSTLFEPARNKSQWFTQSTAGLRYDLSKGNVTVDDIYKILPFRDRFFTVPNLSGKVLRDLLALLNSQPPPLMLAGGSDDAYYAATDQLPNPDEIFDAFWVGFDNPFITKALNKVMNTSSIVALPTRNQSTDTSIFLQWAGQSLPPGPC